MSNIQKLPLDAINILAGTQSRAQTNDQTVRDYADALEQDNEFPPVVVFSDGSVAGNWLADGFHRYHGHRVAGLSEIACDIRVGSWRDAKLFSLGANATHGLPRSSADKKRAVEEMLDDPEWSTWTQAQIASVCRVSREYVSRVFSSRKSSCDRSQDTVRIVERNGVTYEQNTAKIGKSAGPAPEAPAQPPAVSPTTVRAAASAIAPSMAAPRDDASAPGLVEIITPANEDGTATAPKMIEVDEEVYHELIRNFEETLAANEMMSRVFDADDRLKAAMDEAARQRAIADSAEQSVAQKSSEYKARADAVAYWQKEAKKEKARADRAEKELAQLRAAA